MEKSKFEKKLSCSDCRHSDRLVQEGGSLIQICRFNPPVVSYAYMPGKDGSGQVLQQSLWPIMTLGDYCGKLETKAN